jgi:hypothetical protein
MSAEVRDDVPEAGDPKLTDRLTERIGSVDGQCPLDVVIELRPVEVPKSGNRGERMSALQEQFGHDVRPIVETIAGIGGRVLGTAWVNRTLRSRIPASKIALVAEEEAVVSVDLPRSLEPES